MKIPEPIYQRDKAIIENLASIANIKIYIDRSIIRHRACHLYIEVNSQNDKETIINLVRLAGGTVSIPNTAFSFWCRFGEYCGED